MARGEGDLVRVWPWQRREASVPGRHGPRARDEDRGEDGSCLCTAILGETRGAALRSNLGEGKRKEAQGERSF